MTITEVVYTAMTTLTLVTVIARSSLIVALSLSLTAEDYLVDEVAIVFEYLTKKKYPARYSKEL